MKSLFYHVMGLCFLFSTFTGCKEEEGNDLKNGTWRAFLKTVSGTEIPFNFEVSNSLNKKEIVLINGKERFKINTVTISGDSVFFDIPLFNSEIRAAFKQGKLYGQWIKHLAKRNVAMPFQAMPGISWRFFESPETPTYDISGRWPATFIKEGGIDSTLTIGEFTQNGSKLTGTFLSKTGDYRFLEGSVSGDSIYLSRFDGESAYLFKGKIQDANHINAGKFYAGSRSVNSWIARKDDQAVLPDAYSLTALKPGFDMISFSFPNLDGKKISLSDEKFQNKVVVIQMLGSWCSNCMDETAYMSDFYKKYHSKGVEVIGLAYEATSDFVKSKKRVENLQKRFDVPYELLLTGYTNEKGEPIKSLPQLASFSAFPTTFILDKKGKVRKIHTGFSGPGTGQHYQEFVQKFEKMIDDLLQE
ncbi:MAG: peroxiredoxin family protein [Sphingobacteriaceae bacterium]